MAGVTIEESDDGRSIVTPGLRLDFRWTGDRWTHALAAGPGRAPFASAVEADPARDDFRGLPSPTFQDLHLQPDGPAVLAMLVGQFGPRHFSAAFRVTCGEGGAPSVVEVDVADRCREPVATIAASYGLGPLLGEAEATSVQARWTSGVRLALVSGPGPEARLRVHDGRLTLVRDLSGTPGNGRLIYRWDVPR